LPGAVGLRTLAHAVSSSGKKILLLERGDFLPGEVDSWNPKPVFVDGKYITHDTWYDADGKPFQPQVHYYVGGATKMYGAGPHRGPMDVALAGVAHQSGTCRFGTDPATSVPHVNCRARELDNLYVADTSFFPSIGAVNPALTAMANAIRVGEHLTGRLAQLPRVYSPQGVTTRARAGGSVWGMRAGLAGVVFVAAAALLGAGCSSSGGNSAAGTPSASPPSASPSSAVCPDVAALRSAMAQVGHLSASAGALDKLKADLTRVRADVTRLRTDAGGEWKTEIDELNSALVKLEMTLKNIGSQPSATAAATAVSTQLAVVTTKASDLLRKASVRCPAASATPSA
jgi:GMC oxidoreductase